MDQTAGIPAPELLAPAGDRDALRAALSSGADAVYLGMERWGARAFAGNFDARALLDAVDLAHLYGARVHLTLNTLLKDGELEPALQALAAPYEAGLDAVLVADLGLAARIRERYPGLALHASTQLNTHSSAQLDLLARLGFTRAVLARELSLDEIRALDAHGLQLEVFVHGALCYGYSGLCLFSSMVGGRSGNRGRCAQACRMRYRLAPGPGTAAPGVRASGRPAGAPHPPGGPAMGDVVAGRVLSAADLAAIDVLPQLVAAGVSSLKIEGRMKDAAYVATAVSVYRDAVDAAAAEPAAYAVRPEWRERLEQSFSRGFTTGHLDARHSRVRSGGRGGHRGVLVGRVERVTGRSVVVRLSRPVDAGDVVCLYTSRGQTEPQRLESGGADRVALNVGEPVAVKDRLFRLAAAGVDAAARDAVTGRRTARPLPLAASVRGAEGRPAELVLSLAGSRDPKIAMTSRSPLEAARAAPLDEDRIRAALAALGGTPYELRDLAVDVPPGLFLPVAELRDLRRRAIAALDRQRLTAHRRPAARATRGPSAAHGVAPAAGRAAAAPPAASTMVGPKTAEMVLRLSAAALTATDTAPAPSPGPGTASSIAEVARSLRAGSALCLDVEAGDDPARLAALLEGLRADGVAVRCRPPVVLFDTDSAWWRSVAALPWDAVYARHAAHLSTAAPVVLEYPLQGLNAGTAAALAAAGAGRISGLVLSPESSLEEIDGLAGDVSEALPGLRLEILAFGRQELLPTRDRLGEAEGLLTTAGPQGHVRLLLEDTKGFGFPVTVDARGSHIYNARVTNLARAHQALRAAGVHAFIIEMEALSGEEAGAFAAGGLAALVAFDDRERHTTGHLFRGVR